MNFKEVCMSLNSRAMKYIPTSNKKGKQVAMGFAVEAGELESISCAHISDVLCDGNRSFVGVITRTPHDVLACGQYVGYSEDDMISIRLHEAIKAANIGSYQSLYLLNDGELEEVTEELVNDYYDLLITYKPDIVYTYSPFDTSHEHIVSLKALLMALNKLEGYYPEHIYAVNFDFDGEIFDEDDIVNLDITTRFDVIESMLGVYVSLNEADMPLYACSTAFDLTLYMVNKRLDLQQFVVALLDKVKSRSLENLK